MKIGETAAYDAGVFIEWSPVHAENDADGAAIDVYADGGHTDVGLDIKPQSDEFERINVSLCLTPEEAQALSEHLKAAVGALQGEGVNA